MHFGVETMTNEGLAEHDKHCDTDDVHRVFKWCKEEGLRSVAYIMIGGPQENSKKEVLANLEGCLHQLRCFCHLYPLSKYTNIRAWR